MTTLYHKLKEARPRTVLPRAAMRRFYYRSTRNCKHGGVGVAACALDLLVLAARLYSFRGTLAADYLKQVIRPRMAALCNLSTRDLSTIPTGPAYVFYLAMPAGLQSPLSSAGKPEGEPPDGNFFGRDPSQRPQL